MGNAMLNRSAGFTLIEILVALVIVSVGVLALGSFGISSLNSGQVSRERLTAVHLAEQVLEFWQNDANDQPPVIATGTCLLSKRTGGAVLTVPYNVTVACTPDAGIGISYSVAVKSVVATAPLPTNPVNSFSTNNDGAAAIRDMVGTIVPVNKVVTVTWTNKGKSRSIFLTHISQVQ